MTKGTSTAPVLVTGGTGTLGQHVVEMLRDSGRQVRVLSRGSHEPAPGIEHVIGDLATGHGIGAAIAGAETVVHLAGSATGDDDKARHLVDAAARAGAGHLVYISVVGADAIPMESAVDRAMFGYFGAKREAERVIAGSGVPWTTLRATQFHELFLKTAQQMSKLPVVPAPGFRFQPVAAREVAERLVELALEAPAGLVPDIGGPRVHSMGDLLRSYLRAAGKHRPIVPMPVFGKAAAAFRAGANLAPDRAVGRRTWEEFIAAQVDGRGRIRSVGADTPAAAGGEDRR